MKTPLAELIRQKVKNPQEAEVEEILGIFEPKHYRKGEILKHPHTTCTLLGFVLSGSVRSYGVKDNGDEITGQVVTPNNFVSDPISVRESRPTPLGMDLMEDSSLLVANIADYQALLDTNLALNIVIREHMADRMVEMSKRQALFLSGTAKERYQFILENNPSLLKKLPLRLIASMIGITPTQLSRIRGKK